MMLPILQVGDVLISPDILTEKFCCDLDACGGACCIEGDAGAPLTLEEVGKLENVLETVWGDLSAEAKACSTNKVWHTMTPRVIWSHR